MAIRAGLDLARLIPWLGALILATLAYYIVKPLADSLDVGIAGVHPFRFLGNALEAAIVEPLNDLRSKSDAEVAKALSSLLDNLAIMVGLVLVLGILVKAALTYMWDHALRPLIHSITEPIRTSAAHALARAIALEGTLAHDVAALAGSIEQASETTLRDARRYAESVALTAEHAAERYADEAVSKLRAAEDTAVENVARIAHDAEAAGLAAARAAEAGAEAFAASALATAEAAFDTSLGQVRDLAIATEHGLTDFEQYVKGLGVEGLIAGSAALATVVTLVLAETGLGNQSCRGKVKQICGTDPRAWEGLLAGLLAVGFAFNLKDLYAVANGLVGDLSGVIAEAA